MNSFYSIEKYWDLGLKQCDIEYSEQQLHQLKQYVNLLERWNKTYNLTAIRDPKEMIPLHIFDSIVVASFIKGGNCLDVGSGAGLPSIPLAILQSQRQFTALDTNGKKTRFIQHVIIELGLKNINVVHSRTESWQSEIKFDAIISRAFASIHDFVNSSEKHLAKNGILYAMKGQFPEAELQELQKLVSDYKLVKAHDLDVPFVDGKRHLLEILKEY